MTSAPLEAGARIGKFVITRLLGEGGMGTVYEARDPELSRAVAIKLLRDRASDPARLLREAQALARISHPNVVGIYELGSHADEVFVAMELVDGVTIDRYLTDHACPWPQVLGLYVQAGRGLAAVHEQGLVHRDFKPSNVLVDGEGRVRVGDFGLARRDDGPAAITEPGPRAAAAPIGDTTTVDGDVTAARSSADHTPDGGLLDAPLTAHGAIVGTPRYMAPEQLVAAQVTRRADQFGFAVALWEALYGAHPFGEGDRLAMLARVAAGQRQPAPAGTGVPARVERALGQALARDPAARWPSMTALLDALERTPRRRRRVAIALAGGAVAIAVVAAFALTRPDPPVSCARADEAVAEAWSAEARTRTLAAFAALGPAWAPTGDPTARALDRWSARARAIRIDACQATHARQSQTEALLDKRVACLDDQQAVFVALIAALARADVDTAAHAATAIDALPAPETCTATRVGDTASAAPAPALEQALATATVAVELQRPDARALTTALLDATRALSPALRSRAHLLHARVIAAADPRAARDEFATALTDAASARDPGLEAMVLLRTLLIAANGESAERIDALLPVARAAVTRAGDPAPLARELAFAEVAVHARLGRAEPARLACERAVALEEPDRRAMSAAGCACHLALLAHERKAVLACDQALALRRQLFGDRHPLTLDMAHERILALLHVGRATDALADARANLASYAQLYGPDSTHAIDELQLVSTAQGLLGKAADSRATLAQALAISDRISGVDARQRVDLLAELTDRALTAGDPIAIQYADSALAAAERHLDPQQELLATILALRGKALGLDPPQLPRALESWRRAIELTETTAGPGSFKLASVLSSYSYFLANRDRLTEALVPATRALPIFDALGEALAAARTQGLIGEIWMGLGKQALARAALLDSRRRFAALGPAYADELANADDLLAKLR